MHRRADTLAPLNVACKSTPYISTRHVAQPVNFNGEARIGDDKIVCRHLAAQFILTGRADISRKIAPHELFGTKERISETVSADIESKYEALKRSAYGRHIVVCDRFGGFLARQAESMQVGDKRLFLLLSGNHAMAFELRYKPGQSSGGRGNERFVVRFFDPNLTNVVARCQVEEAEAFNSDPYALRRFMSNKAYHDYFASGGRYSEEKECLILDCSDPRHPDPTFATLETASGTGVSAALMYHLLRLGSDPGAIRALSQGAVFQSLSPALRREALAAKTANGVPGLYVALQNGHADTIAAYGRALARLLDLLPAGERSAVVMDLLAAKRPDGVPGLYVALQNGHADTIAAYGRALARLLDLLPAGERSAVVMDLLAAKCPDRVPGLYLALQNGRADTIAAYGRALARLLDLLPAGERSAVVMDLLAAKCPDRVPGLHLALRNGRADAIKAYGGVLEDLDLSGAESRMFLDRIRSMHRQPRNPARPLRPSTR